MNNEMNNKVQTIAKEIGTSLEMVNEALTAIAAREECKIEDILAMPVFSIKMLVNQQLLLIATEKKLAAKTAAKTERKQINELLIAMLKPSFKVFFAATKTDLETAIAEKKANLQAEKDLFVALTAKNEKLHDEMNAAKTSENRKAKIAEEMNVNTDKIRIHTENISLFETGIKKAEEELKTATDKWEYTLPEFGTMPEYTDILAYYKYREDLEKRNSGRTSPSANKTQQKPKYDLSVAELFADKVCSFLGIKKPAAEKPAESTPAEKPAESTPAAETAETSGTEA